MTDDLTGSTFLAFPLEKHLFVGNGNEWLCLLCNRPRALHRNTGFKPAATTRFICMDQSCRFSRHPHFNAPGSLAGKWPP